MSIKINSIFRDAKIQGISSSEKLLYIYLVTNPDINVLGVCSLNLKSVCLELNLELEELRSCTSTLVSKKLIKVFKDEDSIYFLVLKHFDTQPKGTQTLTKAYNVLATLPETLSNYIKDNFDLEAKSTVFIEPTEQEIEDFAMGCGFSVSGKTVIEYYRGRAEFYRKKSGWYDGKGKQVIDWKRKVRNVWCKDTNKLKENVDSPKGFEFFHIISNGKPVYPDYWKEDKPYSRSGVIETTELQEAYERKRNS